MISPGAVLDLAGLGVVGERARTAAEVVAIVKRLGGARFQPTSDVIAGRMASLVQAGFLHPLPDGTAGEVLWELTPSGCAHVQQTPDDAKRSAREYAGGRLRLSQDLRLWRCWSPMPGTRCSPT